MTERETVPLLTARELEILACMSQMAAGRVRALMNSFDRAAMAYERYYWSMVFRDAVYRGAITNAARS